MKESLSIGNNIKKVRELKGISRRFLAMKLNISLTAYGNIERGKTKYISKERIFAIADLLEVHPQYLYNLDSEDFLLKFVDKSDSIVYLDTSDIHQHTTIIELQKDINNTITKLNNAISALIEKL